MFLWKYYRISQLEKRLAAERSASEEELDILSQRMKDENERLMEANKALRNQLQAILQMDQIIPSEPNDAAMLA